MVRRNRLARPSRHDSPGMTMSKSRQFRCQNSLPKGRSRLPRRRNTAPAPYPVKRMNTVREVGTPISRNNGDVTRFPPGVPHPAGMTFLWGIACLNVATSPFGDQTLATCRARQQALESELRISAFDCGFSRSESGGFPGRCRVLPVEQPGDAAQYQETHNYRKPVALQL